MLHSLSIVILAYNEAPSLREVVLAIFPAMKDCPVDFEVLIVDDGSTDETPQICEALEKEFPCVRTIRFETNCGLGSVFVTGFTESTGDAIAFFPGDGQYRATQIKELLACASEHDLVLGVSRPIETEPLARVLSWVHRQLYRILFGRFPDFRGIFLVRREFTRFVGDRHRGRSWTVVHELILRTIRRRGRIVSIPLPSQPRQFGESKVMTPRTVILNFLSILRLRFHLAREDSFGA